jgi:MscS family membrane protein
LIGPTFAQTQWWEWGVLFVAIFVGLALGKLAQSLLRGGAKRLEDRGADIRATILADAASPVSLVLFTVGMSVGLAFIRMAPEIATFAGKTTVFLVIISAGWFLYNLIDLADVALKRITDRSDSKIDNMIVPLVRKTLRIFLVIVFTIVVLQNVFDMNITGFLASLGIAGLAISLAAQDSVKNLFGSITVFFDKPFVVGDRIVFDGYDGVVEEIGFRSTRIRTLVGHLITVPNMKFIDGSVENVAARPYLRRLIDVTITYDTPADKIELAVRILKDILNDPQISEPFDLENMPPRVSFNDFNATSLNIKVFYWYQLTDGRDYWGFLDHSEKVNMRLFKAYGEAGIEFAFPTQTVYLAGDPARELRLKLESGSGDDDGPRAYT